MKKEFNYEMFNYNEFINNSHSFDEVRELLKDLELARCYRIEDFEYIEKEYDILVDFMKDNIYNYIEEDMCKVAHLVLNNAFFIISKGAEYSFEYELTEEDKRDYRFSSGDMKHIVKLVYGGCEGTIGVILDNGEELEDFDFDAQDMEMLATFFYDIVAPKFA